MNPVVLEMLQTSEGRDVLLASHVQPVEHALRLASVSHSLILTEGDDYRLELDFDLGCVRAILSYAPFDSNLAPARAYWQTKFHEVEELRAKHPDWFRPVTAEQREYIADLFCGRPLSEDLSSARSVAEELWIEICRLRGLRHKPLDWSNGKPKLDDDEVPSIWDRLTEV